MAPSATGQLALLVALSLSLASCSKTDAKPDSKTRFLPGQGLAATWRWVHSSGGQTGAAVTPASTQKTITLKLNADRTYSIHTNGVLDASGTYSLTTRRCIHDHTYKRVIVFVAGGRPGLMIEQLSLTTLSLSDEFYDGYTSLYQRQ